MGHCGNADFKDGDVITSLRKPIQGGLPVPAATFIYNNISKSFGEMKGKHNSKPDTSDHEYIVGMLSKSSYLNGKIQIDFLRGGGYMPSNNFSLNDLPESLFKQLCQANGTLIANQIKNSSKVSEEQKLDARHMKWAQEILGDAGEKKDSGTLKYMQDQ